MALATVPPFTDATCASLRSPVSESGLRRRWLSGSARNARTRSGDHCRFNAPSTSFSRLHVRSRQSLESCDGGEELVAAQSRRSVVKTGAALALLSVFERFPALAEEAPAEIGADGSSNSTSVSEGGASGGSDKPKKRLVDTESWYRFKGEGFKMTIPPTYEDIVEYDDSGTSLYGERAKEKPFAARFASPDRKEVLSVVVRNGSQLKLSFLQTQDITEFGSLEEAAKVFVPAGSKIVAAAALKPSDSRVLRTYYLYEFLAKDDKRVVMSAAAAAGRVFVFGAMAPNSRWKEVGSTMRSAAVNFALL